MIPFFSKFFTRRHRRLVRRDLQRSIDALKSCPRVDVIWFSRWGAVNMGSYHREEGILKAWVCLVEMPDQGVILVPSP
jgi:hypothetical protein